MTLARASGHYGRALLRTTIVASVLACGCGEGTTGPDVTVAAVTVSPSTVSLYVGQTRTLEATALNRSNQPIPEQSVTWTSSDDAVASVANGTVTAHAPGAVTIRATISGKTGTSAVTVALVPVASISVAPGAATLFVGHETVFTATLRDSAGGTLTGRTVTWTSSDPSVLSVGAGGQVTAKARGSASVIAEAEGKRGVAEVAVTARPSDESTLALGDQHTCAIAADGRAFCWGNGVIGQLGNGAAGSQLTAGPVSGGYLWSEVTAGSYSTCALTQDKRALCWGRNHEGNFGNGSINDTWLPTPAATGLSLTSIVSGFYQTCGLTTNGSAYCWGLGIPGDGGAPRTELRPVAVAGGIAFRMLAVGSSTVCGLTMAGEAYCWGGNFAGGIGDGTTVDRYVPTRVTGGLTFATISVGRAHTCGLTAAGRAYCWGLGREGQLGNGSTGSKPVPTAVAGDLAFGAISAANQHTCGLTADGAVYCWGANAHGQLGDGTRLDRHDPGRVSGSHQFRQLEANHYHSCARTRAGSVYCWGMNGSGQLGEGTVTSRNVPTLVLGFPDGQ